MAVNDESSRLANVAMVFAVIPYVFGVIALIVALPLMMMELLSEVVVILVLLLMGICSLACIYLGIRSLIIRNKNSPGKGKAVASIILGVPCVLVIILWVISMVRKDVFVNL